ncbi:hypothetical protein Q4489_15280 [Thalassotalea sp. 1_MG-2023]|uniref:hypothetical protein n=1 Tax=Thalassotalea sp. 1_MG-2023 TaxID=3062680 RepID=UPI0026E3DCF0|nr:hypothetical protein [Thalassotalea sp. 1_MG-2023]MDO6428377.1 hypothetical protein [Thalassotalea sp. 1_MG-2023]
MRKGFLYYRNIGLAIFGLVGGIYFLVTPLLDPVNGLPEKDELTEIRGTIEWVKKHKYGVKFKLADKENTFNYPSKANSSTAVNSALSNAGHETIAILAVLDDFNTNYVTGKKFIDVYQVVVDDKTIRSYEQVRKAWEGDNKVGLFLGPFMIFAAFYIFRKAKKGEYGSSYIHY